MKHVVVLIQLLLVLTFGYAQVPQAFKYQAIARGVSGGLLVNKPISVMLSIKVNGIKEYVEKQYVTTNQFGTLNLDIGKGIAVHGLFSSINWGGGECYIEVAVDETGGENFVTVGSSQLLSVPYAFYSGNASNSSWISQAPSTIYTVSNVGIGVQLPSQALDVKGNINLTGDIYKNGVLFPVGQSIWNSSGDHIWYKKGRVSIGADNYWSSSFLLVANAEDFIADVNNVNIASFKRESLGSVAVLDIYGYPNDARLSAFLRESIVLHVSQDTKDLVLSAESETGRIRFFTDKLLAENERMTIAKSGQVGIGVVMPQRTLHVKDVIRLEPIPAAPSNPSEGDMYMNSQTHKLMVFDGTVWQACW